MIDSAMTTDDTTIATTGREALVRSVTGLGTDEPSDGVEEEGVGTGELKPELRLGATETEKKLEVKRHVGKMVHLHVLLAVFCHPTWLVLYHAAGSLFIEWFS